MRSGTGFVGRICVFLLTLLCLPAGVVSAQQASEIPTQQNNNSPAGLPPVQPAVTAQSDAAVSSAGKNDSGQNEKSIKDTEDDKTVVVKLGPGDLIEVGVYNVPELASKVRVSNSGDIYLPLIDYVHVEGLTQEEAQELIEKRLEDGGFVRSPHVSIFVDEAMSQGVTILGEVGKPGIYPDIGDHKLYSVISQAGGFGQNASRKIAILRHNQADPIRVNLPHNLADDMGSLKFRATWTKGHDRFRHSAYDRARWKNCERVKPVAKQARRQSVCHGDTPAQGRMKLRHGLPCEHGWILYPGPHQFVSVRCVQFIFYPGESAKSGKAGEARQGATQRVHS